MLTDADHVWHALYFKHPDERHRFLRSQLPNADVDHLLRKYNKFPKIYRDDLVEFAVIVNGKVEATVKTREEAHAVANTHEGYVVVADVPMSERNNPKYDRYYQEIIKTPLVPATATTTATDDATEDTTTTTTITATENNNTTTATDDTTETTTTITATTTATDDATEDTTTTATDDDGEIITPTATADTPTTETTTSVMTDPIGTGVQGTVIITPDQTNISITRDETTD